MDVFAKTHHRRRTSSLLSIEYCIAKVDVAGSNPVSRSIVLRTTPVFSSIEPGRDALSLRLAFGSPKPEPQKRLKSDSRAAPNWQPRSSNGQQLLLSVTVKRGGEALVDSAVIPVLN